jgi:hypothetical protein
VGADASFIGGNVGIGTSTPRAKLHVEGGDLLAGAPGEEWIFHTRSHAGSDFLHITDSVDGAYQFQHGLTLNKLGYVGIGPTSGSHHLEVAGSTRISGRLNVDNDGIPNATMAVRSGLIYPFVVVNSSDEDILTLINGKALGTPNFLQMFGGAKKSSGGTSWEVLSDSRLKQDVGPYELGLNEILQLRTVRFRYSDDTKRGLSSTEAEVGFIAQEVREVIPEAVTEGKDGYLSLSADPIHWAAINAIQELNAKLEAETAALRVDVQIKDAELQDLKRQFAEWKTLMHGLAQANGGAR